MKRFEINFMSRISDEAWEKETVRYYIYEIIDRNFEFVGKFSRKDIKKESLLLLPVV